MGCVHQFVQFQHQRQTKMKELKERELEKLAEEKGYNLDYLTCGSPIFQVKKLYTFTSDSISLAHAVKEKKIKSLVDLCSGSGVVGMEVAGNNEVEELTLVELQKELADASSLSAELFTKHTKVNVINKNLNDLGEDIKNMSADVVVCNPPYFKSGSGETPDNFSRAVARHELTTTLEDIVKVANRVLVHGGKFYMIHLFSREKEIEKTLTENGFVVELKTLLEGKLKRMIFISKKN